MNFFSSFPALAVVVLVYSLMLASSQEAAKQMSIVDRYKTWSSDPPDSEGLWWIHGDEEFGTMGGNYTGSIPPEEELHVVKVQLMGGHLTGSASGRFIRLTPFNVEERKPGYVGVWKKVTLPELPKK